LGTELRKFGMECDEDVDVVYTEVEVDIDVDAEVDVEGRERSTVLVEESVSTTSTTAHVPLLLSVEEAEVPLDRRRCMSCTWSMPIDFVLDRRLEGTLGVPVPVWVVLEPEEVGWDLTTRCSPKPVNRAGEVLYRNILGLIGADGGSRPVMGTGGVGSKADMDARVLKAGICGGEWGDEGEPLPPGLDNVMVAIEVPLDSITVRLPGEVVSCGHDGLTSDIRRGSAVGE
jgi:hypothetical protein